MPNRSKLVGVNQLRRRVAAERLASGCRGIPYPSLAEVEYQAQMEKMQEVR